MDQFAGAGTEPTLNQISVYLLKADIDSPEDALRAPDEVERHPIPADRGLEGVLFVKPPSGEPPSWLAFLESMTGGRLDRYENQHVSAVLLVNRGGRTFAVTFGYGRHLLEPGAFEPDFGLKVAAGLIDPEAINAVDSRVIQASRLQVRRQAGRATTSREIGVNIGREMLRALSGKTIDESLGTRVSGTDALGLAGSFDVPGLLNRLDVFHRAHEDRLYREAFPHLDRWSAITDPTLKATLDNALLEAIQRRDPRLGLAVPEVIDWRGAGFRFSREPVVTRHAFPRLEAYLETREEPTLRHLRTDRLMYVATDSDDVVDSWSIYRAIEWEHELAGRVYFLTDNRWYEVAAEYLAEVDQRLASLDRVGIVGPAFDPVEWEEDFNVRLADRPDRYALDKEFAYFEDESGRVEICDVFTADGWFIHVKRDFDADGLSHLFGQGAVSADLFTYSPSYRETVREKLAERTDLAETIPASSPSQGSFGVGFGIISTEPERVPLALPVFSRIHLLQMAELILRLGMRLTVYGIATEAGARPTDLGPTLHERRAAARNGQ